MELYQLRTFLTIASEGQLTRAAEKLCTSQPAISAQVRALEEELGIRLFERGAKGMILTAAGRQLEQQARRIVEATRDFKTEADSLRRLVAGEVAFGLNNRPEMLRVLGVLNRLSRRHPELHYNIICGSSGVILQGLDEGTIAIGFFEGECDRQRLTSHKLTDVELCLIAPIAWKEELSVPDWKKLEARPWIFMTPMCSYFRAIDRLSKEQGLNLSPRFRINEDLTVFQFVAEGLGISLVGVHQVAVSEYRDRICVLPHFNATVPLSLGYQSARANDPVIKAVREAVLEVWQAEGPVNIAGDVKPAKSNRGGRSMILPKIKAGRRG